MNTIHFCPICGDSRISDFLRRDAVPVHQNLLMASRMDALQVARGDLNFALCHGCGFIFNRTFDIGKLAYGVDYDNTQSHSPYFARYMAGLADHLLREEGVINSRIIEVGCGKGTFLKLLVADPAYGNSGFGFDPSYAGPECDMEGRLKFERCFYDEKFVDLPTDVVICRHVIEHVPRPLELLQTVRRALSNAPSAKLYFETPCAEWILRNHVFWDFFYEHCSLFSFTSLRTAFERAGFSVHSVRHLFGGQYIWLEAGLSGTSGEFSATVGDIPMLGLQFGVAEKQLRENWKKRIVQIGASGRLAIWGAGAKGTTFAHLMDPENKLIDCIVDLNPNKQGKFLPGTGHPVVGVKNLNTRRVRSAILMNPIYREENETILAEHGITIELIE